MNGFGTSDCKYYIRQSLWDEDVAFRTTPSIVGPSCCCLDSGHFGDILFILYKSDEVVTEDEQLVITTRDINIVTEDEVGQMALYEVSR